MHVISLTIIDGRGRHIIVCKKKKCLFCGLEHSRSMHPFLGWNLGYERAGRAAFGSLWRVSGARWCRVSLPTATTVKLQDAFPRAVLLGWAVRVRVRWEARESARVPLLHSGPTPPPAAAFRSVGWTALVLGRRRRRRSWPRMAFAEWATQPGREKEAREAQNQLLSLHVRLLQYTRYVLSSRIGRMAAAAAACDATAPPYSALPPPPS